MKTKYEQIIIEAIDQLLAQEPRVSCRYGIGVDDRLHIIKLSPGEYVDQGFILEFEDSLVNELIEIDITQSVLFVSEEEEGFDIINVLYEQQGELSWVSSVGLEGFGGRKGAIELTSAEGYLDSSYHSFQEESDFYPLAA